MGNDCEGKIFLDCQVYPVKQYEEITQCFRYEHTLRLCQADKETSAKCTGEHLTKKCTTENHKCINWAGVGLDSRHRPDSRKCHGHVRELQKLKCTTDYGESPSAQLAGDEESKLCKLRWKVMLLRYKNHGKESFKKHWEKMQEQFLIEILTTPGLQCIS